MNYEVGNVPYGAESYCKATVKKHFNTQRNTINNERERARENKVDPLYKGYRTGDRLI